MNLKTGDLSAKKDDCKITVIRSGGTQTVSVLNLVVGDVVLLSTVSPQYIYI
jgi:magnesium-transporting ATPase (P-type)